MLTMAVDSSLIRSVARQHQVGASRTSVFSSNNSLIKPQSACSMMILLPFPDDDVFALVHGDALLLALLFGQADGGDLRVGVDAAGDGSEGRWKAPCRR